MNPAGNLSYDVFFNAPPPQDGLLPNGEPKRFSPMASTLIYGTEDAVLTDPGMTEDQARVLGDWVAARGRNVTDIFITHGHGDHFFAAGLLAERFGARVVATAGLADDAKPALSVSAPEPGEGPWTCHRGCGPRGPVVSTGANQRLTSLTSSVVQP